MSEIEQELASFVPHPGSRMDKVGRANVAEQPAIHEDYLQEPEPEAYVVQTRQDMPEETIPRTMALSSSNPYLSILPRDMRRRRAVILPVDNDVILCETKELAQSVASSVAGGAAATTLSTGFYLPKGASVILESRDWMFAVVTTNTGTSRVSVVVERYADAEPN